MSDQGRRADEARLDELRRKALAGDPIRASGVVARGGPTPAATLPGAGPGAVGAAAAAAAASTPSYYGRPVLKPPPWTWEVPLYLFAGGVAGASAVLALAARVGGAPRETVRAALWMAIAGVLLSAALLVSDLGRPARFLHMLRVFKWRSPMSVGAWLIAAFGGAAALALTLERIAAGGGGSVDAAGWASALVWVALLSAALLGALVATYTGVLLAVTVVPAWNTHALLLPLHFGAAALGSAAALLELISSPLDALHWIGLAAAATETAVGLWTELRGYGARDRALRSGRSGVLVRASTLLAGPTALLLRLLGLRALAAIAFLLGALVGRFGWLEAGRTSTEDPAAAL